MKYAVLLWTFILFQANRSEGRPGFFEDVAKGVGGTVDHLRDQAFRAAHGVHQTIHHTLRIPEWHGNHGQECGHEHHQGNQWNSGYRPNQYPGNHGYNVYPGYEYGPVNNQGKPGFNPGSPTNMPDIKPQPQPQPKPQPQPQPQPQPKPQPIPTQLPNNPNAIDKKPPQEEEEEEEFNLDIRFGEEATVKPRVVRSVTKPEGKQLIKIMPCPKGERKHQGKCRKVIH